MIFFNWEKIISRGKKLNKIIKIFYYHSHKIKITSVKNPMYPIMDTNYYGYSFVLDPISLFSGTWSNKEKIEYLALAALRSYNYYDIYGDSSLDFRFSSLSEITIEKNPLLELENGRVYFKFER